MMSLWNKLLFDFKESPVVGLQRQSTEKEGLLEPPEVIAPFRQKEAKSIDDLANQLFDQLENEERKVGNDVSEDREYPALAITRNLTCDERALVQHYVKPGSSMRPTSDGAARYLQSRVLLVMRERSRPPLNGDKMKIVIKFRNNTMDRIILRIA